MSQVDKIILNLNSAVEDARRKSLKVVAIEGGRSIRKNFDEGGRPKWIPRKKISKKQKGTNILVISGRMKNVSETVESDRVVFKSNPLSRAYAAIQHFGGTISMPARKILMRKTKSGRRVFAKANHKRTTEHQGKAYTVKIPARPWLTIPQMDFPRIFNAIKSAIKL